jgi:hypothetical protein
MFKKCLFTVLCLGLMFSLSYAGTKTITATWDHVPEADLEGFTLVARDGPGGTELQNWDIPYTGETEFEATVPITVPDGAATEVCFVVNAYDTSENHSEWSNEACITVDELPPNAPTNMTVIIQVVTP